MSTEWREFEHGQWWLVFTDAPAQLGAPDGSGVLWPPSMYVSFPAQDDGTPYETACLHLWSLYNGVMPDEPDPEGSGRDYMHICGKEGLTDLIAELTDLRDKLYGSQRTPDPGGVSIPRDGDV